MVSCKPLSRKAVQNHPLQPLRARQGPEKGVADRVGINFCNPSFKGNVRPIMHVKSKLAPPLEAQGGRMPIWSVIADRTLVRDAIYFFKWTGINSGKISYGNQQLVEWTFVSFNPLIEAFFASDVRRRRSVKPNSSLLKRKKNVIRIPTPTTFAN